MTRPIVTQQAVNKVAEALLAEGSEPSIVAVQSLIGGGSYSTVKRCLDAWKRERAENAAAAPDTPLDIQAKGQEFIRAVWVLASREAQREAQKTKDEAHAEIEAVRTELAEANAEIARLEGVEAAQAATIEQQETKLREAELALTEAQTQTRRVPELEKALADVRAELSASRKEATDKAVEAGRLTGEAEALRANVRELMVAINAK